MLGSERFNFDNVKSRVNCREKAKGKKWRLECAFSALADLIESNLDVLCAADDVPKVQVRCAFIECFKQVEEIEDPHFILDRYAYSCCFFNADVEQVVS